MVKKMSLPFFTIGHSTRTIEEFAELLLVGKVEMVVDVRRIPRSRTNPQYNLELLPKSLSRFQIECCHIAELGGLRSHPKTIPSDVNSFWQNRSFHNYADYALTEDFWRGFQILLGLGKTKRCAVMCSEAVWWRCHRRIIADYLLASEKEVFHLMGKDREEPAHLTEGAVVLSPQEIIYP